jgi:hypothetical protein
MRRKIDCSEVVDEKGYVIKSEVIKKFKTIFDDAQMKKAKSD